MLTTNPFDDDKLREECGVFGICGTKDAASLAALGLHSLQHRGQEAAGIVAVDNGHFNIHRSLGQVGDIFDANKAADIMQEKLTGHMALGHVRYATTGESSERNIQPLYADLASGGFALAHNGNISNASFLRRKLVQQGAIFQSSSDTEAIVHMVAKSAFPDMLDKLIDALKQVEGAYSLICLTANDGLIACRDPLGIRPLVMGRKGDAYVFASETVALDMIGAKYERSVEPGEMIVVKNGHMESHKPFLPQKTRNCIFEYIYFSRPDSIGEDGSIYNVRKAIGAELARENPANADLVIPVPDSGTPAAIGYSQQSGLPFELGIIRSHYIGRTFIQPGQKVRNLNVKMKHSANRSLIKGKSIVLIDNSIVRGTTSHNIVDMMRNAGAKEVHMRIASPPTVNSCFYGVDTPEREKLLAAEKTVEEMRRYIKADSLAFLSIEGLYRALGRDGRKADNPGYCDACFTSDYPTMLTDYEEARKVPDQFSLLPEQKELNLVETEE